MSPRHLLLALALATVGGAGYLAWHTSPPETTGGAVLQRPLQIEAFELRHMETNDRVTHEHLAGHWTLVSTGFTHCPKVCPLTTAELGRALSWLPGELDGQVRHWFVTVDPVRDTGDVVRTWLAGHGLADSLALGGDADQLRSFSRAMRFVAPRPGADRDVAHTGSVGLVDPRGRLAALFRYPHRAEQMAETITELIRREEDS